MLWMAEDAMCGAFLTLIFQPVCPIRSPEVVADHRRRAPWGCSPPPLPRRWRRRRSSSRRRPRRGSSSRGSTLASCSGFLYRLLGAGHDPLLHGVDYLGDDVVVLVEVLWVLGVERDPRTLVLYPCDLSLRWDTVQNRPHEAYVICLLRQTLTASRELSEELLLLLL